MSETATDSDLQLLARYTRDRAEDAFAEIVRRHLDLVHSAALRQVRSPQLAEEVAQSVFTDLARNAHRLAPWDKDDQVKASSTEDNPTGRAPNTILTAWLYQVTRRTAIDVVRREARRQLREQIATEMNVMNAQNEIPYFAKYGIESTWPDIEPLLDEAMHALDDTDRAAVLLRYFENKSLREVGATLGTSDDAAQKRVSRAVERLREFFAKRGVTVGASGLVVVVSANAVQAAPAGLALTISAAAVLTGTTLATTATVTATKAIAMTTLTKTLIAAALATAAVTTVLLMLHSDSAFSPNAQTDLQTNTPATPKIRSDSAFWRRVEAFQRAQKAAQSADAQLLDSLARLKVALYAPQVSDSPNQDPAYTILYGIPLAQRAAALDLVTQALRDPEQHVCRRAISLIPLIWPQGEAALPTLFALVRDKSGDWPGLASDALIAAVQVRSETDVIPELVLAAMQGGSRSQSELAMQFPLLTAQIKDSSAAFAASLQPFLYSTDPDSRLTAAQSLAQLPGAKDATVVAELAASLASNDGTRATEGKIRASLNALLKMGTEAGDAAPALLALAKANPELSDAAMLVLKAVAPDALKGVGVSTPLPPHEGTSQAISDSLAAGTWTIQNAIDALKSPDLLLPTVRALADFGPAAAEALPALRKAMETLVATNPSAAIVVGAAIERLDPQQPKPLLLLMWDIMPALDKVRTEAQQANVPGWEEALASLRERVPLGLVFDHPAVRKLATELGRVDPRLQRVFQDKLLEVDAKFAAIFASGGKN